MDVRVLCTPQHAFIAHVALVHATQTTICITGGHSREVYTTKRMQRVFAVKFSGDATYVFSGSDDMNVRVWKVSQFLPFDR